MNPGALLHNLVLFGRLLRGLGLDVNPGHITGLAEALQHVEITRRSDFYHAARCLFVHKREEIPLFDAAFAQFWRAPETALSSDNFQAPSARRGKPRPLILPAPLPGQEENAPPANPPAAEARPALELTRTYSDREVLRRKDFSTLTAEETEAIKRLIAGMVWTLGARRTRRFRSGPGNRLDLRRTLRRNLRNGGEVFTWAHRQPRLKPRPLVILADISGSMESYTRLLLHFIYALAEGLDQKVEVFVFSTRLSRITRQLNHREVDAALREVSRSVTDWSGGTRIGEALKTFNFEWGRRVLGRGAVTLIISDGWDRGDIDLLGREMARLRRSCHRLIWLNPLLGSPVYEPLTRGIQAALPHVDDFLPVHNLASLEDLARKLGELPVSRHFA